jgi:Mrp family chromosome partitioning ATPase
VSAEDPQIPIVELLPAFEEETGLHVRPAAGHPGGVRRAHPHGAQLRALAGRVRALGRDKRLRRIGVVGSVADEGSTTVALGLARALGTTPGQRVLFLELDFAHPAADRALGSRRRRTGSCASSKADPRSRCCAIPRPGSGCCRPAR